MTEDPNHAAWLEQARSHLGSADPVLARLIDDRPDFDPWAWLARLPPMDLYGALLFQVAGQQLSVAATRTILLAIDWALVGDDEPVPMLERPHVRAMRDEPDARKILVSHAGYVRQSAARTASLYAVIQAAAGLDTDIRALAEDCRAQ
jgi:hypothetical protein